MAYTAIKPWLDSQLKEIHQTGLFKGERAITTPQGAEIETADGPCINFCANNYLGMANHPEVLDAVAAGLKTHGFCMASVRFICGTLDIHQTLERRISDALNHASTIDGVRLCRAQRKVLRHNDTAHPFSNTLAPPAVQGALKA